MNDTRSTTFWVIAGLALLWNLMGLLAFVGEMNMTAEMIAELPAEQQALYAAKPAWVDIVFGLSVISGVLACVLLLLKKPIAHTLFWVSLVAVIAQTVYVVFLSGAIELNGVAAAALPCAILLVAVFLVWYSKKFT